MPWLLLSLMLLVGCERKLTRKEAWVEIQRCKDFGYQPKTVMRLTPGIFYTVKCE